MRLKRNAPSYARERLAACSTDKQEPVISWKNSSNGYNTQYNITSSNVLMLACHCSQMLYTCTVNHYIDANVIWNSHVQVQLLIAMHTMLRSAQKVYIVFWYLRFHNDITQHLAECMGSHLSVVFF